ncbi:TatD family hydrolase [Shewanella halifaxensis]|uniref:TatD family hydrolase n=1 Tax=Shewanella halifaxensis TaxID=271098 RepID=UPI000D595CD3|nr:TatD family hydrolase [Shewanella halifaxensis]
MDSRLQLIDSHAHLDFPEFDTDRAELIVEMQQAGISNFIVPGVSATHWQNQLKVVEQFSCFFGLGIHPWYSDAVNIVNQLDSLHALLASHKKNKRSHLVAVGECGLDKLHNSYFDTQLKVFTAQIEFAIEFDLPLIIHAVKAHEEVLKLLKVLNPQKKGVIHGFYGGPELASRYVNLGYKLGIGGLLLNDNAPKLQHTVAQLPLDAFVLETDSPAMAPKNSQNYRNTPLILPNILQKIANLQKKSAVLISEQMFSNVTQLFDL